MLEQYMMIQYTIHYSTGLPFLFYKHLYEEGGNYSLRKANKEEYTIILVKYSPVMISDIVWIKSKQTFMHMLLSISHLLSNWYIQTVLLWPGVFWRMYTSASNTMTSYIHIYAGTWRSGSPAG